MLTLFEKTQSEKIGFSNIFVLLRKEGIIGNDLAHEMIGLVTYRNLLSHEYHGITEETLFDLTKKTDCIRQFVTVMQEKIEDK